MSFTNEGTLTFALKGNENRRIFAAYATGELEIKGTFHLQGPQPVSEDGGAPEWVADFFDNNLNINQIALSGKKRGVVYRRMDDTQSEKKNEE